MNAAPRSRLGQLPNFLRICVRQVHGGARKKPARGFQGPEGHGENIWVFSHRRSDQIIYSFENKLDGFHDLKQLPFNGKNTKPAKLRKDYWSPFANIIFPAGQGSVGRSVFQKLRELKHLHEVAWDDEFRYKRPEEFTAADRKRIAEEEKKGNPNYRPVRTKEERGIALNRQKSNSIADMAAVLSGMGRGNKLITSAPEEAETQLMEVTVSWANDLDKEFAEEWSNNVTHELFETPSYVSGGKPKDVVAAPAATTEPAAEKEAVEAKKEDAQPTPQ
ncbi:Fc.00g076780.m01.CDS01 [Cosmosporella sp. VM-42]